ncbi:MAG TPA: glycoside hydrolase family 2, partial [Actinomycetota bacterium]|nr:glycoside hydrolase family 2 [Actinomycetota bacterium]
LAPADAGAVGAGASMAFRRDLALSMGLFDAELDAGTRARSGGDTYAFSRLLNAGYRIVYTPDAVNWHRHRRERADLVDQVAGYGVGMYSMWTKLIVEHRDLQALRSAMRWFRSHHLKGLARALLRRPGRLPLDLVASEMKGMIRGPFTYVAGRKDAHAPAEAGVRAL